MASYVVKADDIREVIRRIKLLTGAGAKADIRESAMEHLIEPSYRRIRWFFYCDDREGITIRVFDRLFRENYRDLLRGGTELVRCERVGKEGEQFKTEMLKLFTEIKRRSEFPRFVRHDAGGNADCLDYFEKLNDDSPNGEVVVSSGNQNLKEIDDADLARYQPLVDATFLDLKFFARLERLLLGCKQVILEGPPGAGKTWVAKNFAKWWTHSQQSGAKAGSKTETIQFHESYGYEDFFQGIRPQLLDENGKTIAPSDTSTPVGQMVYRNSSGIFYQFCEEARRTEGARFVLIIDEINRGKASRIFGELLYLLEYRDEEIKIASGDVFTIPEDIYLIGTMNTADRSIALVDYALRRRFKFVALQPYQDGDAPVLRRWLQAKSISDSDRIVGLFCKLNERIAKINPHFIVGHSYFMDRALKGRTQDTRPEPFPDDVLRDIWRFSILPLLSEYEPHRSPADLEKDYGLRALLDTVGD